MSFFYLAALSLSSPLSLSLPLPYILLICFRYSLIRLASSSRWDYYGGREGGGPHSGSPRDGGAHPGYPASYSPEGRRHGAIAGAYPGPPPQSSYAPPPPATGGYAPYPPPSSYPLQYQQHHRPPPPSQGYPPHHPAYSQYPHPPPHHYRHPHPGGVVPPPRSGGVPEEDDDDDECGREKSHPWLRDYNPDVDGAGMVIRPQFQNVRRGKSSAAAVANAGIHRGMAKRGSVDAAAVAVLPPPRRAAYLSRQMEDAPMPNPIEFAPHTPRRRRRRNPTEKAAAAAAMAAAAAASLMERRKKDAAAAAEAATELSKRKNDGDEEAGDGSTDNDDGIYVARGAAPASPSMTGVIIKGDLVVTSPFSEEELKTLGSGDDEDIPAAKRAAMASAVALRAAAGGSPVEPPKSASEVDFNIADPPMDPITEPSDIPALESANLMTESDVLCGRGGGTNSQMGNRRFRALVRDFQPTYLMAKRREKPKMARSVVLIVRHRGGRFLRRDDTDGRLYEVGDEKAEAKTSQALREGLDVRATKTAANTLMGTTTESTSKKRKHDATSPSPPENGISVKRSIAKLEGGAGFKDRTATVRPQPVHAPGYGQASRPSQPPPAAATGGYYPPYPPRYDDPYYRTRYPPTTSAAAAYDYRTPSSRLPPGTSNPPSAMHHYHVHHYAGGVGYHYSTSHPGYAGPQESAHPSPSRSSRETVGNREAASIPSDAAAFSPPRNQLVKHPQRMPQHLTPIVSQRKGNRRD